MYQALYRKYRPRTFDDVCGQEVITTTLRHEIAHGRASHAYLFTGLRGCGKTTCSKIIAKAVNCLHPQDGNPCCECDICRGIDSDAVTDVMEIDAASNSGVDYMRELREQAFYRPVQCKKRVYIIDEAHMLSPEAFNALLKIMEEPPEHVLFILATTEVHKVPATIISRCQRFDFKRIEADSIADRLTHIAQAEGFTLEREAGLMIARLAEGGMRDAISLLDQCWSSAQHIDLSVVAACAGMPENGALFSLSRALAERDCAAALLEVGTLCSQSVDVQRLCEQLTAHFRNLMLARCAQKPEQLLVCLPQEVEQYRNAAASFTPRRLLDILDALQDALAHMGRTPNKRMELEMALVRICEAPPEASESARAPESSALEARVARLEAPLRGQGTVSAAAVPQEPFAPPVVVSAPTEDMRKAARPFDQWAQVLEQLQAKNKALHGALAGSQAYTAGDLLLIHSQNELFLKLIRENDYAKQNIHECILDVVGRRYRLGPYKESLYRVERDPLDDLRKKAEASGVPVRVAGAVEQETEN